MTTTNTTNWLERYNLASNQTESAKKKAELLWEGEHLILVREGPESGIARATVLARKEAIQRETRSPYEDDPRRRLHFDWVHEVGGMVDYPVKGRWSPKLREQAIEYAQKRDTAYPAEQAELIKAHESTKAKEAEKRKREVAAVERVIETVQPLVTDQGIRGKVEPNHNLAVGDCFDRHLTFSVGENQGRIKVSVTNLYATLTEDQFARIVAILDESAD